MSTPLVYEITLDIESGAIPGNERARRKAVAHVVDAWAVTVTTAGCTEPDLAGDLREIVPSAPLRDAFAFL